MRLMKELPLLQSIEQFLFEVPPYTVYALNPDLEVVKGLYGRTGGTHRVDGHCPFCHRPSTFTVRGQGIPSGDPWNHITDRFAHDELSITCVRNDSHRIYYYFRIQKMTIEKIGQYPSLATVSNDEVAQYRKHMTNRDAGEFHRAIGLAAHGVGVGSFVYLRRVFERLIYGRFQEFKKQEGWDEAEFFNSRMEDKIALIKDHLPNFLVENRRVYSILSLGIHELEEEDCLKYFEALKQAIIIILEDDKKTKEELQRRQAFAAAIARFSPPESEGTAS